jgi:hypothetical protein
MSEVTHGHIKASAERALATGSGALVQCACGEIAKVCAGARYKPTFSVDSVRSEIVKARPQLAELDRVAAAGLTTLIEYLAAEIFELAGNAALDKSAAGATAQPRIAYCPTDDLARFDEISMVIVRECHVREAVAYDDKPRGIFPRLGLLEGSAGADGSGGLLTSDEAQPMDVSASGVGASTATWHGGHAQLPPAIAHEISRRSVEVSREEFVQGKDYFAGQDHDDEEGGEEAESESEDGHGYDRYHREPTPRVLLYARNAIVLWPRSARLEVVAAQNGLGFAVRALSEALTQEATGGQPAEDAFLGFGNSLELLTAIIRLQHERSAQDRFLSRGLSEPTVKLLITALFKLDMPLAHFAAFMSSGLLCNLTDTAYFKNVVQQLCPIIKQHGYAAMREPLSSCLSLATAAGKNEAQHAGTWQSLLALSPGADPSLTEAPPDGAREVCADLAAALVLSSRAAPVPLPPQTALRRLTPRPRLCWWRTVWATIRLSTLSRRRLWTTARGSSPCTCCMPWPQCATGCPPRPLSPRWRTP